MKYSATPVTHHFKNHNIPRTSYEKATDTYGHRVWTIFNPGYTVGRPRGSSVLTVVIRDNDTNYADTALEVLGEQGIEFTSREVNNYDTEIIIDLAQFNK